MKQFTIILTVLALCVVAFVYFFKPVNDSNGSVSYESPREIIGSSIGGPFSLIDENGEVFDSKEFKRPYRLIYFGFSFCPAICPTELAKTVKAFNQLSPEKQDMIDLVFISVDPERDTPDVLKQYTELFHERLIGLTGSQDQINDVLKDYKVFAAKVQDETMSDYTMDHSSFIYLFTVDNNVRAMYRINDEADFIARDLDHLIR